MVIEINGLKCVCRHGVHDYEKVNPQPFLFDIKITADTCGADDDIVNTVNYSAVCKTVLNVAENNCFNLIETLAKECAFAVMENFGLAKSVTVTVHKPQAPIKAEFGDVKCEYLLERNTVFLSLGSNLGDRQKSLDCAIEALGKLRGVKIEKVTPYEETQPYGGVADKKFLNCVAQVETLISPFELLDEIHKIENAGGRVRAERWGNRTVDIDIIFFGSKVIAENGLIVPHPDYTNRSFVLVPLKRLAPDFVCPISRRLLKDI